MDKTAIVVDASCDLPKSFIDEHGIQIIPIYFNHNGTELVDSRQVKITTEFYRTNKLNEDGIRAKITTAENIIKIFKEKLIPNFDNVLIITSHEKRSSINHLLRETTFNNKDKFSDWRLEHGLSEKFKIKIVDSGSILSGHGLLVFETIRLLTEKATPLDNIHKPIELLKPKIQTLIVVDDIQPIRDSKTLIKTTDGKSNKVSWMKHQVGKVLDTKPIIKCENGEYIAISNQKGFRNAANKLYELVLSDIKSGLERPIINISYAGNLAELKTDQLYKNFIGQINSYRIKALICMMSITGSQSVGKNAISISYIKK